MNLGGWSSAQPWSVRALLLVACVSTAVVAGLAGCQSGGAGREVQVSVTEKGFEPSEIHVKKGETVVLAVTRKTEATCATDIVVGDNGKPTPLPLNKTVLIPLGSVNGTTKFACGMNMYSGSVIAD